MKEDYPGQAYFHEHNPRVKQAELASRFTISQAYEERAKAACAKYCRDLGIVCPECGLLESKV